MRWVVAAFAIAIYPAGDAAAATCLERAAQRLTVAMRDADPLVRQHARGWYHAYGLADELGARGMLATVQARDLKAISVTFSRIAPIDMPFPGATLREQTDEMYRAIGELVGPDFAGFPGLEGKIGNIVSDSRSNQIGSMLDIKVARESGWGNPSKQTALRDTDLPVDQQVGFEKRRALELGEGLGVVERRYDLVDPDPSSPFGGICHENKNWPSGWTEAGAISDFMDEFRRDIVLHAATDFRYYRLNLRQASGPRLGELKQLLDQQFSSSFVNQRLDEATRDRVKAAFDEAWAAGNDGDLLRLF